MDVQEVAEEAACLPMERLEAEIQTLAGHLAAAECRWLLFVAEFDRREGYRHWGCWSAAMWLSWKCGIAPRAAKEKVRVARALENLPAVTEVFARGELSYSQVRAITRVADAETESTLLGWARHSTAAQLERIVRAYRGCRRRADETGRRGSSTTGASCRTSGTTTAPSSVRSGSHPNRGRRSLPSSTDSGNLWIRSVPRNIPAPTSSGPADP